MVDKREQLVRAAFDLFYRDGIHAVGVNRVLSESGIAKKTLYHHFPGKDDLVAATVEYRHNAFLLWLEHRLEAVAGKKAVDALYDALDDWFNGRDDALQPFHGCFFINVSAEFGDPEHPIHRLCAEHKRQVAAIVRCKLAACLDDNEKTEQLLEALMLLKEGAIVQAHVAGDKQAALKAKDVARMLLASVGC
ncbi:TetR/AcrR family transcriptional regulator [Marinobacterium maritimum]|uniref:TetR/AcrR family transcriptional regulator n=1 Tax=Marinobacterium maritimum TaxID=500162 RepID=A0ABN1I301_9GAMM